MPIVSKSLIKYLTILTISLTSLQTYATTSKMSCSEFINRSASLTPRQLKNGAEKCAKANRQHEANFLAVTSRIRLMSDIQVSQPILSFNTFNSFDKKFFADMYRTKIKTDKLFAELEKSTSAFNINRKPHMAFNDKGSRIDFKQLYKGYNGLKYSNIETFDSALAVKGSWLTQAISARQLDKLLARVNFDKKMLIALNMGQKNHATQNFYITKVLADKSYNGVHVSAMVGMTESSCKAKPRHSYPFVLAVVDKSLAHSGQEKSTGYLIKSFTDGCKNIVSGTMTKNN